MNNCDRNLLPWGSTTLAELSTLRTSADNVDSNTWGSSNSKFLKCPLMSCNGSQSKTVYPSRLICVRLSVGLLRSMVGTR